MDLIIINYIIIFTFNHIFLIKHYYLKNNTFFQYQKLLFDYYYIKKLYQ